MLGHLSMALVDVSVGNTSSRNTYSRPASCRAYCIMGTTWTNAQRSAFLADVPTNTWENLDRAPKAEKAHR